MKLLGSLGSFEGRVTGHPVSISSTTAIDRFLVLQLAIIVSAYKKNMAGRKCQNS
jgi:hypothetical protein